jgi:hypothetical protein
MYTKPSINSYATVKTYMAAISSAYLDSGLPNPVADCRILHRALRGAKRLMGKPPQNKLPITAEILRLIRPHFPRATRTDVRAWQAAVLCVFGLLRAGELLSTATNKGAVPTLLDVSRAQWGSYTLNLRASKTDPFRKGVDITFPRTDVLDLDPAAILDSICSDALSEHRPLSTPIIADHNGKPITRKAVMSRVAKALRAAGLQSSRYSGHSFRRGGAQSLIDMGVESDTITTHGRWTSWAWSVYRKITPAAFVSLARRLAAHHSPTVSALI